MIDSETQHSSINLVHYHPGPVAKLVGSRKEKKYLVILWYSTKRA